MARKRKPSIIFIDEIDALCRDRDASGSGDETTSRLKTEFLVQMDGVGNDNEGVFVLAATNLPWVLDPAMRRRFQKRIHIAMPDEGARRRLFEIGVQGIPRCAVRAEEVTELARQTEGYSGSDISVVIQDALMMPVKKVHTATHYRKVSRQVDGRATRRGAVLESLPFRCAYLLWFPIPSIPHAAQALIL